MWPIARAQLFRPPQKTNKIFASAFGLVTALSAACAGTPASSDPGEWTFERAKQRWQTMVRPVQHVGVPGYQWQVGVLWDGALVVGPLDFLGLHSMQVELAPLGETRLHVSVGYGETMRLMDRKGAAHPAIGRHLEEGRLPIPHVVTTEGDLVWDETVFAHLLNRDIEEGMNPTSSDRLVTHATFRVTNKGHARRTARLWLHFGDASSVRYGYKATQDAELSPAIAHRYEAPFGMVGERVRYILPSPEKGELRWYDEVPPPTGMTNPAQRVIEWAVTLSPGETAELRLSLPYGPVERDVARQIAVLDTAEQLEKVRRFWRKLVHGPGQIQTPDTFINDYLAAVAGQMAQQVAFRARTRVWMYKTSPNHYEGYWPCNAAKALPALDFRGLSRISRPVLGEFVKMQTDDVRGMERGAMGQEQGLASEGYAKLHGFLGNFGDWTANPLLLSHGMGMWALASHYRITRDRAWLGGDGSPSRPGKVASAMQHHYLSALQAMIDAFDWVSAQRKRTMREADGKKVEHWGLLPAASAHDWLAGNTIFNDAFCVYGMAEIVRLLREIKHPRADEMARELADYRACIRDRYTAARDRALRIPLSDGGSIPYVPRIVQELDWRRPDWTYTGYGPLRAGAWGALDPHDELVDQTLAFLEAGMPKGDGPYFSAHVTHPDTADINWADVGDPSAERHYLWRHYVEYETMWPVGGPLFLARDDLPRYFEWLFHNLAAVLHHDWRVGVESLDGVPSCAPGDGERWQCVRKMFVHERGGWDGSEQSLWLLQAIPRSWLRRNDRLAVRDMGTLFGGRINLEVQVAPDGDSVLVNADWRDFAVKPADVVMRLRSGDGRPLNSATVNGRPAKLLGKDTIELPAKTSGSLRIFGKFR